MQDTRRSTTVPAGVLVTLVVLAVGLVLGGATSYAQTALPGALLPIANSSSGWTVLTVLIVWIARRRAVLSALLGVVAFEALVEGYAIVSRWRGFDDTELLFLAIAVPAGVAVGVAASWLRTCDRRAAAAAGLLAGIGLGETAFTLLVRQAGAGLPYWTVIALLSVTLLIAVAITRLRRLPLIALEIGLALVFGALFLIAYLAL